mmetsp:Transcript_3886/g.5629  ORF Transcript_3886/g.5629 Transcript_3886/m.5629 type:complete len:202 (+) Transcript_3886:66-671(+)
MITVLTNSLALHHAPIRVRLFSTVSKFGGAIIPTFDGSDVLHLPPPEKPVGLALYKKAIYCPKSHVLRTSAHVGTDVNNKVQRGMVGVTFSLEDAQTIYARHSGLRLLATIHNFLNGDFDRVEQVLHLNGIVNADPSFTKHGAVIDGCSQVLVDAFGPDKGIGTRACYGTGSMVGVVSCWLELRIKPERPVFGHEDLLDEQ